MSESPHDPSPVPADRDLWPGELPFTGWGQHEIGEFDLPVFDQDVYWVAISQAPHPISEMSTDYIRNVLEHLVTNAAYFHLCTLRRSIYKVYGDLLLGRVPVDVLAAEAGAAGAADIDARAWLESTPLMRAPRARAAVWPR